MKPRVFVSVPASSGNVGVGFDVLGLALSLRNELTVRVIGKTGRPKIFVRGEGVENLPVDEKNIVFNTMKWLYRRSGRKVPQLEISCLNRIPLARGLGSSSTAYLAALLAANRLLGNKYNREQILDMATELEGHPDNVAPALYGGMRISGVFQNRVISFSSQIPKCALIAAVPSFSLSTKKARAALPSSVPLKDAVHNLASVALLPHVWGKKENLLGELLQDRLHEPYRAKLIPGFYSVRKAARAAGAYALTLSGAGPTLLAFAPRARSKKVAKAMAAAFKRHGIGCITLNLKVDQEGAIVK